MIQVSNLSKTFHIPHAKKKTLFHNMLSVATRKYEYEEFFALNNVSFHVRDGEFLGIIGDNGSGKSTLLKILSRIYLPSSGTVTMNAEVFPLLELGVGFQPDFSVRENIYLYGALLGFPRKEMNKKLDEILDFAELDRFADARLEKLSSGMQMRLGFSIAIQSIAPIMLVDEVFAVGDFGFIDKCRRVMVNLKQQGVTILFVSHDLGIVREVCDRVMVLADGVIINDGKPGDMIDFYTSRNAR